MAQYPKSLLLRIARQCRGFVARNANVHGLTHVFFTQGTAIATNGNTGIVLMLPGELRDDPLEFSVNCDELLKILQRTQGEIITIDHYKERPRLRSHPFSALLPTCKPDDFPQFNLPASWKPFPPTVWTAMRKVYKFISHDQGKPIQCGVYVAADGKAYATDNYRVASAVHNISMPPFFVPSALLKEIIRQRPPDAFCLRQSSVWSAYLTAGSAMDYLVVTRLLHDNPPDYASVFKMWVGEQPRLMVHYHPAELRDSLKRILLYVSRYKESCLIKLECCTKTEVFTLYPRGLHFRRQYGLDVLLGLKSGE
jgi:DNA polymerase III sliding clamp (beta) subunit (PCNA family)